MKREIFYSLASSSKTKRDIGMGPTGEMMPTYRAINALLTNSGCGVVLTVFCLPEVLIVEQNPPERKFLYMLKIFSQEDFALKSKL